MMSAPRAARRSSDYANTCKTFGQPIAERQAIQWMIADS